MSFSFFSRVAKVFVLTALFLGVGAFASGTTLNQLNATLQQMLKQFNSDTSIVTLNITRADVNQNRATGAAGNLYVKKVGASAQGALKMSASYSYPVFIFSRPVVKLSAELDGRDGNMLKILNNLGLPKEKVDSFYKNTQDSISEIASEILKEYGKAAQVDTRVIKVTKDQHNDYQDLEMEIMVNVDPKKVSAPMKPEDVPVLQAKIHVNLDLSAGFSLSAKVLMNKDYNSFRSDQTGLKEYIESLLKQNSEVMGELQDYALIGNMVMDAAVGNVKPEL